jgi:addiction module HigA family antidote
MTIRTDELDATDFGDVVDTGGAEIPPAHPGEILHHEFMQPLAITPSSLARALGVPTNRITVIVHGERRVSADTALRLARHFGTTPEFWLSIQSRYDLAVTRNDHGAQIFSEVQPRDAQTL